MALKNETNTGYAPVQTVGSNEIAEIIKDLVIEVNKPGHDLQPKDLQVMYGTSVENRKARTFGTKDAQGHERPPVVFSVSTPRLAQGIYNGVLKLSSDDEIRTHLEAQATMKEKILRMETARVRAQVLV
jgi:hypothetical protein